MSDALAEGKALFLELGQLALQLDPGLRLALEEEWTTAARFEHASIASFNKFSLELLAVGAPAELVAASNRAALQEVGHARLSFALASAYAGRGIGPGPLAIDGLALSSVDLSALARATVREGCIEETLAAAEAACAEERASVPAVCWVLSKLAREEGEHAALAFRFVRWACDTGGPEVRAAAEQAFRQGLAECLSGGAGATCRETPEALEAHGRLGPAARAEVRAEARAELLVPAYRELFA